MKNKEPYLPKENDPINGRKIKKSYLRKKIINKRIDFWKTKKQNTSYIQEKQEEIYLDLPVMKRSKDRKRIEDNFIRLRLYKENDNLYFISKEVHKNLREREYKKFLNFIQPHTVFPQTRGELEWLLESQLLKIHEIKAGIEKMQVMQEYGIKEESSLIKGKIIFIYEPGFRPSST